MVLPLCRSLKWAGAGEEAAVDGQVGAGDVGRLVRQQERDGRRDILRPTGPPELDACLGYLPGALGVDLGHLGVDDA